MAMHWGRIRALSLLIAVGAAVVVLAPLARIGYLDWAAARAETRIDPHPAADTDEMAIVSVLLEGHDFEGMPPPPPPPPPPEPPSRSSRPAPSPEPSPVVDEPTVAMSAAEKLNQKLIEPDDVLLVDTSVALCDGSEPANGPFSCAYFREALRQPSLNAKIPPQLARELLAINAQEMALPDLPIAHARRISQADIDAAFGKSGGWEQFYQRYPDTRGIARVSRAALTADGRMALIYAQIHCGGTCGYGVFYLLARTAQGWEIVAKQWHWES